MILSLEKDSLHVTKSIKGKNFSDSSIHLPGEFRKFTCLLRHHLHTKYTVASSILQSVVWGLHFSQPVTAGSQSILYRHSWIFFITYKLHILLKTGLLFFSVI